MKDKTRIGIDFDNTIICYDELFSFVAKEKSWHLGSGEKLSKAQIKKKLIEIDGNDFRWQELQALVYGTYISQANFFPHAKATIAFLANLPNVELFVVSHKTKTSNYLKHIELIDCAKSWITTHNLYDYIPPENFFFLPTRDEKIKQIKNLKIDIFIDDLEEVLNDHNFPNIEKIHFTPDTSGFNSWEKIADHLKILNEIGFHHLKNLSFTKFPLKNYHQLKRNGNNKIIHFTDAKENNFIIKKYSRVNDSFSTLETEYHALEYLNQFRINTPKPYLKDEVQGMAIYEAIEVNQNPFHCDNLIHSFSQFLGQLQEISRLQTYDQNLSARDSRSTIRDYFLHLERRLAQIEDGCQKDQRFFEVKKFLDEIFYPLFNIVRQNTKVKMEKYQISDQLQLEAHEKILSQSDFGIHNAIWTTGEKFCFIDFEYFGWDDPAKLVADFLHHAGQNIDLKIRIEVIKKFLLENQQDLKFWKRLSIVLDLVGLEWVLIVLNIANPEVLQRRYHANPDLNLQDLIGERLQKAHAKTDLFHSNISSNSVFLSLESTQLNDLEIPIWQQLITSS